MASSLDRTSRVSLALSLAVHVLLVAPIWGWLVRPDRVPAPAMAEPAPIAFTFVEPRDAPVEPPEAPTPLLSTRDQRAQQPDAPDALPQGLAYQTGQTPLPTVPRSLGEPQPATSPAPEARARAPETLRADRDDEGPRPARDDARLALPESPITLPPSRASRPGQSARLPAPEVDQRLTSARAGSTFALNTTAWEFGPYMARLKARIERQIFPPPAFYYGTAAWATRVRFRIAPDGRLERLELLDHRGVPNLQYVATAAVEGAAAYEPLPPNFPEAYLEITGSFYFNVAPPTR